MSWHRLVLTAALLACRSGVAARVALPPQYDSISVITGKPPDPRLFDVADFGAVGDGIADDTHALQAAVNATYAPGTSDCSQAGFHQVSLAGDGKRYRVTAPVLLYIWNRLIGYGATARPVLVLAPSTPGFGAAAAGLVPMVRVLDFAPATGGAGGYNCDINPVHGGNTAFGVGIINVDVAIGAGNPAAVGVVNQAAQGAVLRAMRFTLAPDAAAGVASPGWAHQELVFVGGVAGVLVSATGAWPSIYRDCAWVGQGAAGIVWDSASRSPWEGVTVVRGLFADAPAAVSCAAAPNASGIGVGSARVTVLDSVFRNISRAVVLPPALAAGNSSVLLRNCSGAGSRVLLAASDAAPAVPAPGPDPSGPWDLTSLVAGPATLNVSAPGGEQAPVRVLVAAVPAAACPVAPPLPADTPAFPRFDQWISVRDHGVRGDGVTDDAPALDALLAGAAASGGGALFFPQGVYLLNATVTVPAVDPAGGGGRLHLFGLSCWDVVLSLADGAPGFGDPDALSVMLEVAPLPTPGAGADSDSAPWISGLNIRTGQTWGPEGTNPNPGTLALRWLSAGAGGLQDVFFHPATFPDNHRDPTRADNRELSLVVEAGGGGVFADIWSCNSFSAGGARVRNTTAPVTFYQLSSEHHAGHELWLTAAARVTVHVMQTEDRSPDAAPTSSVRAEAGSAADVTGLFSYYAANVSSAAAVDVDASSSVLLGAFRQWHSYHPMFYNCSVRVEAAEGEAAPCVRAKDLAQALA